MYLSPILTDAKNMISFRNLKLINPIIRAVTEAGCSKPTEIQNRVIPMVLNGRDVMASASEGSGKKAAFVLPILQLLKKSSPEHKKIRALIVAPTTETALKIEENFKLYGKYSSVLVLTIADDVSTESPLSALRERVDILIATPDKLMDRSSKKLTDLSKIEILVLYEADKLFEKKAVSGLEDVIRLIPKGTQTLLFASSVPDHLRMVSATLQSNPAEIIINAEPESPEKIEQSVCFVESRDKTELLIELFNSNAMKRLLVFTDTKYIANQLVQHLEKAGISTAAIHANRPQNERCDDLEGFRNNKINILVTTDIASKDFDIEELLDVVQYDLPNTPETYVRRIERTRRAGNRGASVSFCTADEHVSLKNIQNLIGFKIPVTTFSK